jgi:WD40 repeat protein
MGRKSRIGQSEVDNVLAKGNAIVSAGCHFVRNIKEADAKEVRSLPVTCISRDGRFVLSGGMEENQLSVWEVETGRCLHGFRSGENEPTCATLNADGRLVLSGNDDGTVILWDATSGKALHSPRAIHSEKVTFLSLPSDQRIVLSGSKDNTFKLWDFNTGKVIFTETSYLRSNVYYCAGSLSEDSRLALLLLCYDDVHGDGWEIEVWDVGSAQRLRKLDGSRGDVHSVALSQDGGLAISVGSDNLIQLWDVATGKCIRTLDGHEGEGQNKHVVSVCLSACGKFALSGGSDATIRLWEVASGRCLRTFVGHERSVKCVSLSADGRHAVSRSYEGVVKLWSINLEKTFLAPTFVSRPLPYNPIMQGTFRRELHSADELAEKGKTSDALTIVQRLRSLSELANHPELLARLHKLTLQSRRKGLCSCREWRVLKGHKRGIHSVGLSGDGRVAMTASHDTIKLWHVATGQCLRSIDLHYPGCVSACLSMNGQSALTGGTFTVYGDLVLQEEEYQTVILAHDLGTGNRIKQFDNQCASSVKSVCFSTDHRLALSGGWEVVLKPSLTHSGDGLSQGSKEEGILHENNFNCGRIKLWEVLGGRCLRTFEGHTESVRSVSLSQDGRFALSGSEDKTAKLWEVSTGICLRTLEGHGDTVTSVSLSQDGRLALSGSEDDTAKLWEVSTGTCLQTFLGHRSSVFSVCFSSDSRFAVTGSGDKTVKLWDVEAGKCVHTIEGHESEVTSVCLSSDGCFLLTGSDDEIGRLWLLEWELETKAPAYWVEEVRPFLLNFLTLHTAFPSQLFHDKPLMEQETRFALTRRGKPRWTEEDFQQLLYTLGCAGYGWLRPEGVRRELETMATHWQGPPPV